MAQSLIRGLFGMPKTLAREASAALARLGKRTDDGIGTTVNAVKRA